MTIKSTPFKELYIISLSPIVDGRGSFARLFCKHELRELLKNKEIVQTNYSINIEKGTLRGMHFQYPPNSEVKIITCITGKVWDVVVDLRKNSPTYLQTFGMELSAKNALSIYIPEGFAHGFQTLEDNSIMIYHHTQFYSPESEGGVRFDDPALKINWMLPVTNISAKDKSYTLIDSQFQGLETF